MTAIARWLTPTGLAALLAACSSSTPPPETPRQTEQVDQAAGYNEPVPEPRDYDQYDEDPVWDDMGDFDDSDFRDDDTGPADDGGRGD